MQKIVIITGPTAVGKTEYTLQFAEKNNSEIISCDASAVYQGMDIGTAKPTKEEQARVPHHLIDCVPPSEKFSIKKYIEQSKLTIDDISKKGKNIVVTGGSGFYLKSFWAPVVDNYKKDPAILAEIEALEKEKGHAGLLEKLKDINKAQLGNLDTQNPIRVRKALERCLISGKTLATLEKEFLKSPKPYPEFEKEIFLLMRPREVLYERVALRVDLMIEAGLIEEVENLLSQNIEQNPSAANAIGYKETIAFLKGQYSLDQLKNEITQNTRKFVKKQLTWFRHQLPPHTIINL